MSNLYKIREVQLPSSNIIAGQPASSQTGYLSNNSTGLPIGTPSYNATWLKQTTGGIYNNSASTEFGGANAYFTHYDNNTTVTIYDYSYDVSNNITNISESNYWGCRIIAVGGGGGGGEAAYRDGDEVWRTAVVAHRVAHDRSRRQAVP